MKKAKTFRVGAAGASLLAVTLLGATGGAQAEVHEKAGATVIKMERDGKVLFFSGPATVSEGATLKIKNNTNPRRIGPHTFSLVKSKTLPETGSEFRACHQGKAICGAIFRWHKVDFEAQEVGENPVEVGKNGWDQKGSRKRAGDSWFSLAKDEQFAREVTAEPGTELSYICAIHPEMQGEITVTE